MKRNIMNKQTINKRDEVLGKEFETNNFGRCFVIDYAGTNNVTVAFYQPFCIVKCSMTNLTKGRVSNPMKRNVYGKGYLGVGKYSPSFNTREYKLWKNMLERVYCLNVRYTRLSYEDVEVCEDWHNFQNFAEWCETQKFLNAKDDKGKTYQLDKDILVKGNRAYSPDTCCFVPKDINVLLLKSRKTRGDCLIGVTFNKNSGKFVTQMGVTGISCYIKQSVTEDEAFQAYKKAKEAHIKLVAEKWKDAIDPRAYDALMNYEVDIDD